MVRVKGMDEMLKLFIWRWCLLKRTLEMETGESCDRNGGVQLTGRMLVVG